MPDQVLTEENLAQHTEHHKRLVQKRDFVAEFIEQLVPTSFPRVNPIREARLSGEGVAILRNIQPKSKEDSDVKVPLPKPTVSPLQELLALPPTNAKPVVKKKRARKETSTTVTPVIEEYQRADSSTLVPKEKSHPTVVYKGKGKRSPPSDAIDLDVENLALDDDADTKEYRPQANQSPSVMTWSDRDGQGDSLSQLAVEQRHDGHGHLREPLKERVNEKHNLSKYPHRRHHQPRHYHRHHIQHSLDRHETPKVQVLHETRISKANRNKPRKILTQGSLVMNQFESSKIAKDRITASFSISVSSAFEIPRTPSRLGIFKKGKASTRVAVNKDQGFSENSFLNRCDDSRHDDNPKPMKVITSDYFNPKESQPEVELASNHDSSKDSTNSDGDGSRKSKDRLEKRRRRQPSLDSDFDSHRVRKRARHPKIRSLLFRASQEEQSSQPPDTETESVTHGPPESVYEDFIDVNVGHESIHSLHDPRLSPGNEEAHAHTHATDPFGGLVRPLAFEPIEPLLYYYDAPQAYHAYGPASIPYPTPVDYPPDSALNPPAWTGTWLSQAIEPQFAHLNEKDFPQLAEVVDEEDYLKEDIGDCCGECIENRDQPPRAQFNWRPRRLY